MVMAGIRLDDFLSKKKEVTQVLDLSKSIARTKEDLKKLLDKVPEFKSKAEKIRADDIKIRDRDWTFKPSKKELRHVPEFTFANPVPADMRAVKLDDLISVPIDWRMLTTLRPRTKLEEEYFSRLIELGKLSRATLQLERQREGPRSSYAATSSSWVKRFKSRGGVVETKATTCAQCGDEFCDGAACKLFTYDCFVRVSMLPIESSKAAVEGDKGKERRRKKRKGRPALRPARPAPAARSARSARSDKVSSSPSRRGSPSKKTRSAGGGGGGGAGGGSTRGPSLERRRDAIRHRSQSAPPAPRRAPRSAKSTKK